MLTLIEVRAESIAFTPGPFRLRSRGGGIGSRGGRWTARRFKEESNLESGNGISRGDQGEFWLVEYLIAMTKHSTDGEFAESAGKETAGSKGRMDCMPRRVGRRISVQELARIFAGSGKSPAPLSELRIDPGQ